MLLISIVWGAGISVGWVLTNSGTPDTLGYFLKLNRVQNPSIILEWIMSCLNIFLMHCRQSEMGLQGKSRSKEENAEERWPHRKAGEAVNMLFD